MDILQTTHSFLHQREFQTYESSCNVKSINFMKILMRQKMY